MRAYLFVLFFIAAYSIRVIIPEGKKECYKIESKSKDTTLQFLWTISSGIEHNINIIVCYYSICYLF